MASELELGGIFADIYLTLLFIFIGNMGLIVIHNSSRFFSSVFVSMKSSGFLIIILFVNPVLSYVSSLIIHL